MTMRAQAHQTSRPVDIKLVTNLSCLSFLRQLFLCASETNAAGNKVCACGWRFTPRDLKGRFRLIAEIGPITNHNQCRPPRRRTRQLLGRATLLRTHAYGSASDRTTQPQQANQPHIVDEFRRRKIHLFTDASESPLELSVARQVVAIAIE